MPAQPVAEPVPSSAPRAGAGNSSSAEPVAYDFGRPDTIPGEHLRAIRTVFDNFVRVLASSLSAYLRTYISASLIRIEQLSFSSFSRDVSAPATVMPLKIRPPEGRAILGISHAVLFPMLEILLGGPGKPPTHIDREITEIEESVLEPVIRIVLQELRTAWHPIIPFEFSMEQQGAASGVLISMAGNEAVVAATVELRFGQAAGTLHIGLPSRHIRALLPSSRSTKTEASPDDRSKVLRLLERAELDVSVSMNGARMLFRDLMNIEAGDVIALDHALGQELDLELNGTPKFKGHVVMLGAKRAFEVKRELPLPRP